MRSNKIRSVVVPGCLIRQTYDMSNYVPGFFLYNENEKDSISFIRNEIDKNELIWDTYVEKKEMNDESINAFVETLRGISQKKFTLSFLDNLKLAIEENTLDNECVDFIKKMISDVKK
jgi:hypothetical protein